MPEPIKSDAISVHADPKRLMGHYANAISVTSQERDVVIDFLSHVRVSAENNQASLVSRIFLNRFTAQDLINVLQNTLKQWEEMRYNESNPKK